jgi:ABC-type dipeptide/oligopeptide/nickel transport system permease subunit
LTVDVSESAPLSVGSLDPPSRELPFGSDKQGRNLYAVMVEGTPLTFRLGLVAGVLGVAFGAMIGFIAGYYTGIVDDILKVLIDVGLTIPGLLILIIIAMNAKADLPSTR